jgi:hypothetical protein
MKKFILLVIFFTLTSCGIQPEINLASKATLVHPFITTKKDVLKYLGKPEEIEKHKKKENWFYFHRKRNFWAKVPLLKKYFGKGYTAVLKITFKGKEVIDCLYYTVPERY